MKELVILKDDRNYIYLTELIEEASNLDEVHQVEIKPYKPNLSANQKRLYWLWMREISRYTGYTEEELHLDYKEKFLVAIYTRDDEDYAKMVESVREIHRKGMKGHAQHMKTMIIRMTSITDADTKQMAEYMDQIKMACIQELQLQLPIPEDIGRYHPRGNK